MYVQYGTYIFKKNFKQIKTGHHYVHVQQFHLELTAQLQS
jgi:hypothetical protein